jgi:hypothetical protein
MNKISKSIILLILILSVSLSLFACSTSDGVDYSLIDSVSVNEESIADGFLLSEFDISQVLIDIKYVDTTDEDGVTVAGETVQIPATIDMVVAEDKAQLSVAGSKTINLIYGKFEFSFVLNLYDDTTQKYKVVFLSEDGLALGDTQYIVEGGKAVQPTVPTKDNYDFLGWKDRDTGLYSSYDNIIKDTYLVATYAAMEFTVSYYSRVQNSIASTDSVEGGEESTEAYIDTLISTESIPRGEDAYDYVPEIPVVQGFSNGHWEDIDSMANVSEEGLIFYAIYDQDTITVTFNYKKYTILNVDETKSYYINSVIEDTFDVERDGYKFVGWFTESGKSVTFPYTVTNEMRFVAKYIDISVGNDGLSYKSINNDSECIIDGYDGAENVVVIPNEHDGLTVTGITAGIFNEYDIEEFVISSENTEFKVDAGVLYNFAKTEVLAYPIAKTDTTYAINSDSSKCTSIADSAFANAKNLTYIDLGQTLIYIGRNAFEDCVSLVKLYIPSTVTTIGANAFSMSTSCAISSITFSLPSSLKSINDEAFSGLNNLIELSIPSSVTTIGSGVFYGCKSLTNIEVADTNLSFAIYEGGLYDIGITTLYCYPANYLNSYNTDLELPDTLTTILTGAFSYTKLQGICITSSSITLEEESIISPNLIYLRILSDTLIKGVNIFGVENDENDENDEYIPKYIYVENSDVLDALSANNYSAELFDNADWEISNELNDYYNDFIYELVTSTVSNNNVSQVVTTVSILGCRNTSATLSIPETIVGYDVTAIADYAFCADNNIKTVVLPNAITSIGDYAFADIPNLTSITLNSNLTTIGYRAFYNSSNLKTVSYDSQIELTYLGTEAFTGTKWYDSEDTEYLTINSMLVKFNGYDVSAEISEDIKNIASDAFSMKTNLTSVVFTSTVLETIGYRAFQGCLGISIISLPDSITEISEDAFFGCSNLKLVIIDCDISNSSNISIADTAFPETTTLRYNEGDVSYTLVYWIDESETISEVGTIFLTPITIADKDSLKFAGLYKDMDYTELASFPLTLTDDMTIYAKFISSSEGTVGLKYSLNDNNGYTVVDYVGTDEYVIIPQKYKNKSVTAIAEDAFASATFVTNIILPYDTNDTGVEYSYITEIGENAFDNTTWVNNYLGDFVIINNILVKYNGSADIVKIPSSISIIADGAFYENLDITNVVIPEGVTSIGVNMFYGCTSLISVTLPSTLSNIGENAFAGCTNLSDINFEDALNVYNIASNALDNTEWLENQVDDCIIINDILYKYQGSSSSESDDEGKLTIMNGITQIADSAFENDTTLKKVYLPESMELIGNYAFANSLINEIIIFSGGSNLSVIENYAFSNCINLSKINISVCSSLYRIGAYAFYNTSSLYDETSSVISIPSSLTILEEGVFQNSSIVNIVFAVGSELEEIPDDAFNGCSNLLAIIFNGSSQLTIIGERAFYNCSLLATFTNSSADITTIKDEAFYNCENLYTININTASIQEIGEGALDNMGYVNNSNVNMVVIGNTLLKYNGTDTEVEIPYTITTIYDSAFSGNANLITVVFPDNSEITAINDEAFYDCTSLAYINFPSTIVDVGDDVMTNTEWLSNQERDGVEFVIIGNTLIKYQGEDNQVIIPDDVLVINKDAFSGVELYNIEIGSQVTNIKDGAFDGIITPDSAYTIADSEITTTTGDWSITLLNSVPFEIGANTLSKIYLASEEVKEDYSLSTYWMDYEDYFIVTENYSITYNIDLDRATALDDGEMVTIYSETELSVNDGYVFIGWYLDSGYTKAISYPLILNADLYFYGKIVSYELGTQGGFSYNESNVLESYNNYVDTTIVIPSIVSETTLYTIEGYWYAVGEDEVGTHVWDDETSQYIEAIPDIATHIYIGAFEGHDELITIYFADDSSITTIGSYAFLNCTNLCKIVLPSSITTIEENAFEGCTSLKEIVFTNDVDEQLSIETNAFLNCTSLKTITLPVKVTLATDAFSGCTSLINVYMSDTEESTVTTLSGTPFEVNEGLLRIYVAEDVYDSYCIRWIGYLDYLIGVTVDEE